VADRRTRVVVRRRPPSPRRLGIIVALVVSMMLTLFARLYYVQLLDPHKPVQTANELHDGVIVVPAPRGQIVDATGVPLVANRTTHVVTVDRDLLMRRADEGRAVLRRLGRLVHTPVGLLAKEIRPCSPTVSAPCSTAEPYAPVVVASGVPLRVVLAIDEHREQFPGVAVETTTLPSYPHGSLAAHVLGYTSEITAADKRHDPRLNDADTIGVSGLEEQYDAALRGVDGKQIVQLDPQGYAVSFGHAIPAQQGDTLITSIDGRLQTLAQNSLVKQIHDSRKAGYRATGGAVVIMDPQTGRILAVASYPTYDPSEFIGGISEKNYAALTNPDAGTPLLDRAIAGAYAPGSTFKLITSSSLVMHHEINTHTLYPCPGSVTIDGRVKTNFDSEALGPIDLENALGFSCDTFFYVPAADEYYADQNRIAHHKPAHEWLQRMAAHYGVGRSPGVDLPYSEQAAGSYADRETRMARWKANRKLYCQEARRGYPGIKNRHDRAYLTLLASQNCTDGWRYRAGDNADMAIGQGETTMSPLQLAIAYSALVNGGRIWEPRLGWAVVNSHGHVVRRIEPKVHNRVPVKQWLFNYITKSLNFSRGWAVSGAFAYMGSRYQDRIGGKTGTAQVFGKQDTSWLATWGPTYKTKHGSTRAQLVMVGMVEQAGVGAFAAGPMLKRIWDGIFGVGQPAILPGQHAPRRLPHIPSSAGVPR
jgi:penicillin-binding protein 2